MTGKHSALLLLIFVISTVFSFAQYPQPGGPDWAIDSLLKLSSTGGNRDSVHHSIGSIYLKQQKDSLAIVYLNKVSYNNQQKFNELAIAYSRIDEPDTSLFYLRRAVQINDSLNGRTKNLSYAITCKLLGDYFFTTKNYDSALVFYHQSIIQLVNGFDDEDIRMNPVYFEGEFPVIELFTVLMSKARTFTLRYQFDHNKNDLLYSIFAYDALYNFADGVLRSDSDEEAKQMLAAIRNVPHSEPIHNSLKLYELTGDDVYVRHAFRFDEKSKAVLREPSSPDSAIVRNTGLSTIDVRDAMKRVPRNGAVLSYHVGDTSLVAFIITRTSFGHQISKYDSTINQKVTKIRTLVQTKKHGAEKEIDSLSMLLYDVLVHPVEKHIAGVDQLVVILDDKLEGLPFEMLKNDRGEQILQHRKVSYTHAVSSVKIDDGDKLNVNIVIISLAVTAIGFIIYFSRRRQLKSPSQALGLS